MFTKSAPLCCGNLAADIWAWCITFIQSAASKGKCMHPCFCFQKDHTSLIQGFSIGKDDDFLQDDLPGRHAPNLVTWSQQIHQAVSSSKVFPPGTCSLQNSIIESRAGGHGCKALPATIQSHHLTSHPHPTTSVRFHQNKEVGKHSVATFVNTPTACK